MNDNILSMEEFGLLPTSEKRKYLLNNVELILKPECPFWIERLYYAVKFSQPNRIAFLDTRLQEWYREITEY